LFAAMCSFLLPFHSFLFLNTHVPLRFALIKRRRR
jgi:hypothetical protein